MQPDQHPPESGKTAFRYGLIFGIGLFVIGMILVTIGTITFHGSPIGVYFTVFYWLIGLVVFFLVGIFAAKKTGKVSTGTLAGLWAGISEGALYAIFSIILFFAYSLNAEANALTTSSSGQFTAETTRQLAIVGGIIGAVFSLLIAIGLGAGLGALGGLVGRATSKFKPLAQPYPGQPYPGQPYPGQPYPGQPYPGQPYSGQPYPGQPYPGQPYPGQPYPGQPYPGQPYPNPNQAAQPNQPQNTSAQAQTPDSDRPFDDEATIKANRPPNVYNSYLASQESPKPQESQDAPTASSTDATERPSQ